MSAPERIAYGTLSASAGAPAEVYQVPRQTRVILASILLTNLSSVDVTIGAAITVGMLAEENPQVIPIMPPELVLGSGDSYHLTTPIAIEANEVLYLSSSLQNAIRYYITGTKLGVIPSASNRGI